MKASIEVFYLLLYSNELTLAAQLLEKLTILEYTTYKTVPDASYISSLSSNNLMSCYLQRGMYQPTILYSHISLSKLRLSLLLKCLFLKHTTATDEHRLPVMLIYELMPNNKPDSKVADRGNRLSLAPTPDIQLDIAQAKDIWSYYNTVEWWDKNLKTLYRRVNKEALKSKIYKQVLKEFKKGKASDSWIQMIQKGRYQELMQELVDTNIDLDNPIEKQGEDLKHYTYFLLLLFDIFGSVSYFEAVQFMSSTKRDHKHKNKHLRNLLKTTLGVNLHKRYIKFSNQRSEFIEKSHFKSVDMLMAQILILGYIEDYSTLSILSQSPQLSDVYRFSINCILSRDYSKYTAKTKKSSRKSSEQKYTVKLALLKGALFHPSNVSKWLQTSNPVKLNLYLATSDRQSRKQLREYLLNKYLPVFEAEIQTTGWIHRSQFFEKFASQEFIQEMNGAGNTLKILGLQVDQTSNHSVK